MKALSSMKFVKFKFLKICTYMVNSNTSLHARVLLTRSPTHDWILLHKLITVQTLLRLPAVSTLVAVLDAQDHQQTIKY